MDLQLNISLASKYKSASQKARLVTEDWFSNNFYCPSCISEKVDSTKVNTPVLDFTCPACAATFQLKSKSGSFGGVVANSAYHKKIGAIQDGKAPHYAFLQYSSLDWRVKRLFLVPGHFFTPALIARRKPLASSARRAGWEGSNILLRKLPNEAFVEMISLGTPRDASEVRNDWARFRFLQTDERALGGWGAAVLACVRELVEKSGNPVFSLNDLYDYCTSDLAAQYPNNRNVKAKIRQQLQVLRDAGVLHFRSRALYEIVG